MEKQIEYFQVSEGSSFKLKDHDPGYVDGFKGKDDARETMEADIAELVVLQEKLFAHSRHSVLIILQAMDAAGKDGVIKHVMSGLNPQGCSVKSFKHPTDEDYQHDFFWRYNKALPELGKIGIFNRSYYENVLICRVHPELVLNEHLPQYDDLKKINEKFWEHRFRQINRFEKNLSENGTLILKFFLHISKEEQGKRLLKRIEEKDKQWKFSFSDINERNYWDDYQQCYEDAIRATSTHEAPWYVVPADNKWYSRAAIANILVQQIKALNPQYPETSAAEKKKLAEAKATLLKKG